MSSPFLKLRSGIEGKLDVPTDLAKDLPRIQIMGNEEISIENHEGIVGFEKDKVEVKIKKGKVIINGVNLEILFMGGETLTIGGKFRSVVYEEGNKKNEDWFNDLWQTWCKGNAL